MAIQTLEFRFDGKGEVKGYIFEQVYKEGCIYIYKVTSQDKDEHFEVFKCSPVPICIDFDNRIYSETDFKETYPKSNAFGKTAWTALTIEQATNIFNSIY